MLTSNRPGGLALEVDGITKSFGNFTAVRDVKFHVARGEVCGFIGPNGAGKTTTMRIASTLELPDSGDVLIDGHSVLEEPRRARLRLGFMPDSFGAYTATTVLEYLDFFAPTACEASSARRRSRKSWTSRRSRPWRTS